MFRTKSLSGLGLSVLGLGLMSSAALAQPNDYRDDANRPPAQLNDQNAPSPRSQAQSQVQDQADAQARDIFCRRDAAARTGYVSPGQAASRAQTSGSVGSTIVSATAGAAIGSASGHAGTGALIGAGAGLLAGTAIGADNARRAADDVQQNYAAAYYACMDGNGAPPSEAAYGYGPGYPPPPRLLRPGPVSLPLSLLWALLWTFLWAPRDVRFRVWRRSPELWPPPLSLTALNAGGRAVWSGRLFF